MPTPEQLQVEVGSLVIFKAGAATHLADLSLEGLVGHFLRENTPPVTGEVARCTQIMGSDPEVYVFSREGKETSLNEPIRVFANEDILEARLIDA